MEIVWKVFMLTVRTQPVRTIFLRIQLKFILRQTRAPTMEPFCTMKSIAADCVIIFSNVSSTYSTWIENRIEIHIGIPRDLTRLRRTRNLIRFGSRWQFLRLLMTRIQQVSQPDATANGCFNSIYSLMYPYNSLRPDRKQVSGLPGYWIRCCCVFSL